MAVVDVQIPPSNRAVPGSKLLPHAPFPSSIPENKASPDVVASDWIQAFNHVLSQKNSEPSSLFLPESSWRDLLCMTWDFHTLQGPQKICSFIESSPTDSRIVNLSLDKSASHKVPQIKKCGHLQVVRAFIKVETSSGRGEGMVRLVPAEDNGNRWKALTLFTTLKELKGHEEFIGKRRPTGLESNQGDGGQNWRDELTAQQNFEDGREPSVLIVGGSLSLFAFQGMSFTPAHSLQVLVKADSLLLLGSSSLAYRPSLWTKTLASETIGGTDTIN